MRICYICNEYPPFPHGGVGIFVQSIARALVQGGHQVHVLGVYQSLAEQRTSCENGVTVHFHPKPQGSGRFGFLRERIHLARLVKDLVNEERIDVVEAPEGGGWSSLFALPCPVLIRLHNPAPKHALLLRYNRGRLTKLAETIALLRADGIIAVSRDMAEQALLYYPHARLRGRPKVIYNGVEMGRFALTPYTERVPGRIVFAGTIKQSKGVEVAIRAFSEIAGVVRDAELWLYGKDTQVEGRSFLQSLLGDPGIPEPVRERIHYRGVAESEAMPRLYSQASVCVFPSLAESFGLVAVEAMACGRPVIYTRSSTGPEIIDDGVTGLLADPESPGEWAQCLRRVLSDPSSAAAMGQAAAEAARSRFGLDRCAKDTLAYYTLMLSTPNGMGRGRDGYRR